MFDLKAGLKAELERFVKELSSPRVKEKKIGMAKIEKRKQIELAKNLLNEYRTLVLIDANRLPAKFSTYLRQRLYGIATVKMFKNNLLLLALKEMGYANVDEFSKFLTGSNIAIFTNLNPFEIKLLLDKISMPMRARPGDKIDREIVVPPMRTELKPGPIMSLFGKLKIPIQVRDGVIWIAKEATIARPGDIVTPELASLFDKLGIEPNFIKVNIKVAFERGIVIPAEKLHIDIEAYRNEFVKGVRDAINVASEIVIPLPEIVKISISKAFIRALRILAETGIISKEYAPIVFMNALSKALYLASLLVQKVPELRQVLPIQQIQQMQITSVPAKEEAKAEEKEEKKEGVSEEELAEGLAALFG